MFTNNMRQFLRSLKKIGHVRFAFYILPPFMGMLVLGTLAQPFLGLYRVQSQFFSSWVIWFHKIPIPGGMVLLALITLSVTAKFIFYSHWKWSRTGIVLSHLGVLVLLIGGFLTQATAQEGFIVLNEGGESSYMYDYNERDLYIFKNDVLRHQLAFKDIKKKAAFNAPFPIKVVNTCANCIINERSDSDEKYKGMAQHMMLIPKTQEKEPEQNLSGATLNIGGNIYIIFESMPDPIMLDYNNDQYKLIYGKRQTQLPFRITLKNFAAKSYPYSSRAKDYYSDVIINDDIAWPARIGMNNPLRYRGYTFFQSSFDQSNGINASVLAVVKNTPYPFAYIGTILLAFGLLLHSVLLWRGRV